MNRSIRCLLLSAAVATGAQANPFMAVGDGANLFLTGSAGVRADDNILLAKDGTSDVIFDLTPGLELSFGRNAQTRGSIILRDGFSEFVDHSKYDSNLFSGDFQAKYDDGKMKFGANAGYHELNENNVDVRGLVRRDVTDGGANGEVTISDLAAAGGALTFTRENYHPVNYVDSDTLTIPLDFYYKWTSKIDISLGYQYRDYQAKNASALDSVDSFYNVGARGEFTPKLTGKFAVGYTERRYSGAAKSRSLLGIDASFAYEITPTTKLDIGGSNDFGTSPMGVQQKNLLVHARVTSKLTEQWTVTGGVNYRGIRYDFGNVVGHTDDYWEGTVGASYILSANVRLTGSYVYRTFHADLAASEFDNNVFAISADFRY